MFRPSDREPPQKMGNNGSDVIRHLADGRDKGRQDPGLVLLGQHSELLVIKTAFLSCLERGEG